MKTKRLITYSIAGIVAGLLLENSGLRARNKGRKMAEAIKRKNTDTTRSIKKALH